MDKLIPFPNNEPEKKPEHNDGIDGEPPIPKVIVLESRKLLKMVQSEKLELLNELKSTLFDVDQKTQDDMRKLIATFTSEACINFINKAKMERIRQKPLGYVIALEQLIKTNN